MKLVATQRRLFPALTSLGVAAGLVAAPADSARAAGRQGDLVQSDTLGMNLVTYQFDTGKTSTVGDAAVLTEFVGLHYYVIDRLRLGMNLQFSEQLTPAPSTGSDFRTFALLPQIGWDFWGPLFAALVVTVAPWTSGTSTFDFGFQGVFGAAVPVANRLKIVMAAEVPVNLVVHRTIGFTPLLGVSIRL